MLSFSLAVLIAAQAAAVQGPPQRPTPPPVPKDEIHGIVVRPDGKPAGGARVGVIAAFALGQQPVPPQILTADEKGAFRLETKGSKEFGLRAQLRPFASVALQRVSAGQRVTLKLEAGSTIEGEVLEAVAGKPIAGAEVQVSEWDVSPYAEVDPDFAVVRTKTDVKGRFTLTGIQGGGRPLVRAMATGFGSEAAPVAGGAPVKFRLSPGHDLRGVIVDGGDRPVAKARITLRGSASTLNGTSNTSGRFEFGGLKQIPYDATIMAEGFAPFVKSAIDPETSSLRVVLEKASSVSGRMVDEEGKPLKGVVRLRSHDGVNVPASFGQAAMASVGEDGKFSIGVLRPGSNVIQLAGVGYTTIERTIEIAQAGEAASLGDVVFEAGLTIRGRVVEPGDIGVPGARISAVIPTGTENRETLFAEADSEGRFVLRGLKDVAYMVGAAATGFAPLQKSLTPSADEQVLTLKRSITLSGRIVDQDGAPVGRAQVSAQRGDDRRTFRFGRSEADGRFTFDLPEPGAFTLSTVVEGFESSTQTVQVAGATEIGDWTLSRGLRVRGVVVDGKGTPVQGARVENQSTRQFPITFSETDEKGAFDMRGASPGLIRLVASHRDYAAGQATVEGALDAGGDPDPVRITLTKGGRIEGVVRQRDGSPVAQARIEFFRSDSASAPRAAEAPQPSTLTAADGSFSFANVPPGVGRVTLVAGQGGRYTSVTSAEVSILEGESAQVTLTVRSTVVRGVVLRNGKPAAGLRVSVFGDFLTTSSGPDTAVSLAGGPPWSVATADAEGRFALRVAGPVSGRANINSARGESLFSQPVEIPDVEEFQLNLEFGSVRATGRVIDAATGLAIAEARVSAAPAQESGSARSFQPSARTDPSGVFELPLEPGQFQISINAENYAAIRVPLTVSPPEASLGDISLNRGGTLTGRALLPSGRPAAEVQIRAMGEAASAFAMSGPDGSFTLRGLPDGPFSISARDLLDNVAVVRVEAITAEVLEIRMSPAARITVIVAGAANGKGGATVLVSAVNGEPYFASGAFRTDARGVATVTAPGGLLTLTARTPTHDGSTIVQASPGETVTVTIELLPRKTPPPK
jgi:uncharacterized GH25 family protein